MARYRVYLTSEMRKEPAVRRAEAIENKLIDRYVPRSTASPLTGASREPAPFWDLAPIEDLEILADAWEEADFYGWATNIRAAIDRRTGRQRDATRRSRRDAARYFVYVIELRKPLLRRTRAATRPSVYVGSSALPPAARFKHHKTGALGTSRHVRRHGVRLLPRFYERYNPLRSRQEAQDAEKAIRAQLEAKGFRVYGSCHPRRNGCIL